MMKWSPRTKKLQVKVKPLKLQLQGFCRGKVEDERERIVMVEMKWKGPSTRFVPFYRLQSKRHRNYTSQRFFTATQDSIQWDDEFQSVCDFSIVSKDGSFAPWDVSFNILFGDNAESKNKLGVLGKVSLDLAELGWKMESDVVERKLPITLVADGVASEATLLVWVSFAEVRNPHNSAESDKEDGFFKVMKGVTGYNKNKKNKEKGRGDQVSSFDSDESTMFDSDGSPGNESTTTGDNNSVDLSLGTELGSSSSLETQLDPVHKVGFFSWKRRRLSFKETRKGVPLIKNTNNDSDKVDINIDRQLSSCSPVDSLAGLTAKPLRKADGTEFSSEDDSCIPGNWEVKELVSRDGQAKLKANVFFASFDQRSEKAAGESACTALVAVIAHWLHSNQGLMPTRPEFNSLITEGSSEWRKLCNNQAYVDSFPNKHFDLETVLEAGVKPIKVQCGKSFTGFFSPEKFESLKEAMSFDEIWNEINRNNEDYEPKVYIVSWNDHFFALKVEPNACYLIDSLGERLFEGCNQAYILKFDDSTSIHGKVADKEIGSEEMAEAEKAERANSKEERGERICSGKECCKEYIKRFLAAIPLAELEEDEKKGTVSTLSLLRRLQIDFHYSSFSSLSPSATSSTVSLFSNEE